MGYKRALQMVDRLRDGALDWGPDRSRLLIRAVRELAKGRALTGAQADEIIAGLGIPRDEALTFLREVAERDPADNIVGIVPGLSLNRHPHRFQVDGQPMSAWCAEDTLLLPPLLKQTALVESRSPVSKKTVRLTVSPERIEEVVPAGAVVSIVIVDTDKPDTSSVESIWATFCRHIHFFVSREEAEQWVQGRGDIEILPVGEAFELGKHMMPRLLAYDE